MSNGIIQSPDAQLAAITKELSTVSRRVDAFVAWDDRHGSALKRAWHWRLMAFGLLALCAFLAWNGFRIKPGILPYLYVVDPDGRVIWQGIPGSYDVTDAMVMNHLEDWIKETRERDGLDEVVLLGKAWTSAMQMTEKGSEARATLNAYMLEADPRKLSPKPRTEVVILSKKMNWRREGSGEYRLTWMEKNIAPSGQVLSQPTWEMDARVALRPPKTLGEAQQDNRYGIKITWFSWAQVVTGGN